MQAPTGALNRRRRRIIVLAHTITTALSHRPDSEPDWHPWSPVQILDRLGVGPVELADADELDRVEVFVCGWLDVLDIGALGDFCWSPTAVGPSPLS